MKKITQRPLVKWLIICASGLFLLLLAGYLYIAYLLPLPEVLNLKPQNISTKITDRHGELLYELLSRGEGRKTYLKLSEMPEDFVLAVLDSEDSDFYSHIGVDLGAIGRALFYNYLEQKITSGASTITQQLVRNLLGTNRERNLQEKLLEAIYAVRLSHAYSKDQVLEQYLNTVYFGNLSYGVAEAARNYFGKNLSDLDLAEMTLLAGLPKSPTSYNPLVYPDKAQKRQLYVLERMESLGHITATEGAEAAARRLQFLSGRTAIRAPHFVHHLLNELEEKYGPDFVYQGITVRTTLDLGLQNKVGQIIDRQLEKLRDKNVGNAAFFASTVPDGQVLVWLGSKDFFDDEIDGQVDLITSLRQPGSALKPFLYLQALERGDTLASIIPDLPLKVQTENGVYSPLNYDLDFHGPVRLREALANSFNIPAVRTQEKIGTANFLAFLRRIGLTTLDRDPDYYGLSLTLGGGEIRLYDLANAYLTLANYGHKKEFSDVLEITDNAGKTLYTWHPAGGTSVLGARGEANSALIISTLSDPNARLKSFGEGNVLELSVPAAAKTGTTRNFRDNWTFGFTPGVLAGVWVGNADATAMENISGIDGAGPIWHDFMEYYSEREAGRAGGPNRQFTMPQSLVEIPVCAISGLLPGDKCQESINEWFIRGTEPRTLDSYWQKFSCPESGVASGGTETPAHYYIVYPFPYSDWAAERGYLPPSECTLQTPIPSQADDADIAPITITSPLPGDSFTINPELPLSAQQIPLRVIARPALPLAIPAAGGALVSQLRFLIDGQIVAEEEISGDSSPREIRKLWVPETGNHQLEVQLVAGESVKNTSQAVRFEVR